MIRHDPGVGGRGHWPRDRNQHEYGQCHDQWRRGHPGPGVGRLQTRSRRYRGQLGPTRNDQRPTGEDRAADRDGVAQLASPNQPNGCERARQRCCRGPAGGPLDGARKGNGRGTRPGRERQGLAEPGNPRHKPGKTCAGTGVQGAPRGCSALHLHLTELRNLPGHRRPIAHDTGPGSLSGPGPRLCGGEHSGSRDRRRCAGRSQGCPASGP